MGLAGSVRAAIDGCIGDGILEDYLVERRAEVASMFMTDWDEDRYRQMLYEEGKEEGREEGIGIGREEGIGIGREQGRRSLAEALGELGVDAETIERALAASAAKVAVGTLATS